MKRIYRDGEEMKLVRVQGDEESGGGGKGGEKQKMNEAENRINGWSLGGGPTHTHKLNPQTIIYANFPLYYRVMQ